MARLKIKIGDATDATYELFDPSDEPIIFQSSALTARPPLFAAEAQLHSPPTTATSQALEHAPTITLGSGAAAEAPHWKGNCCRGGAHL